MKFVYILIFYLGVVNCENSFSLQLDSGDYSRTSLEFSINPPVYKFSLRCDYYQADLWISYNYTNLVLEPEDRQRYKCSDKSFTITLSNDFTDKYVTINVINYNTSQKIQNFNFLTNGQSTYKTNLTANTALVKGLNYQENDFSLSVQYPSTVYVEIFKCPRSDSNLEVKQFDKNGLYRNLSGTNNGKLFYDIYNTTNGSFYYRLQQSYFTSPDIFIKYQRTQIQYIKNLQSYIINYHQLPQVQVKGDKLFIQFPDFIAYDNDEIEFRITVGEDGSEYGDLICGYGDADVWRQRYSYYINTYTLNYSKYSNNEIVADFPTYGSGYYNIRATAVINFGTIQQTIPMQAVSVYRNLHAPSGSLLVHILAPIIISVLAIFGLIVGGCQFRKKKNLYQQQSLFQQGQQQYQIENQFIGAQ